MADIFPFRPYRYTDAAGPLADLVTQPYDKINPETQAKYLAASPYNLVRIILGARHASDSATDNVYTRAAASFHSWIRDGILVQDSAPTLFAYFQDFETPDSGERFTRKGFICLGKLHEYAEGVVYRHEQTLTGPKQDRLELLRHTRAHFEQLFLLYPDPDGVIDRLHARGEPQAVGRLGGHRRIEIAERLVIDLQLSVDSQQHFQRLTAGECETEPQLALQPNRRAYPEAELGRQLIKAPFVG
jgi:uncharacterized protein (DUF1015 family)